MISKAVHQAQCDGIVGGQFSQERCQRGEVFTAPAERMSHGELTAFFVMTRHGWTAQGGRLFCPCCTARALAPQRHQGHQGGHA